MVKTKWSRVLRPREPRRGTVSVSTAATLPAVLKGYSGTDKIPERALNSSSFFTQLGMKSRKKD